LTPASRKTEEDYFRDICSLNQKVQDLANIILKDLAASELFIVGSKKERRIYLRAFLLRNVWNIVFSRLLSCLSDVDNSLTAAICDSVEPEREISTSNDRVFHCAEARSKFRTTDLEIDDLLRGREDVDEGTDELLDDGNYRTGDA
jgi:hypothetical protein